MYAEWMLAPSGYYVAVLKVGNKHYYASGRNADILERNIKATGYMKERISQAQIHLAQSKSEQIDLQYASKMFISKYCKAKDGKPATVIRHNTIQKTPEPIYEHITEIDRSTGELVVYKLIEVSRFKLRKREDHNELIREMRAKEIASQPFTGIDVQPFKHPMQYSDECPRVVMNNEVDAA